jgi:hypothetical protein
MWAVITTLSNRIYLNMVAMAKHKASDRLPFPQTPGPTYSTPLQGTFPKVIGRRQTLPPHPTGTRSLTLQAMNSELFYSEYFEDRFSLEHLTDGGSRSC